MTKKLKKKEMKLGNGAHDCTTSIQGWLLFGKFLSDSLLTISRLSNPETELRKQVSESVIFRTQTELIGYSYSIGRRMRANGYKKAANKMMKIINMITDWDLANPEARHTIGAAYRKALDDYTPDAK